VAFKRQRTGPLRRVTRIIIKSGQLYIQNLVELECGHRVKSNSTVGRRAHCADCADVQRRAAR